MAPSKPLTEMEEYEIRMEKIRDYQARMHKMGSDYELRYYDISCLFVLPLDKFLSASFAEFKLIIENVPRAVKHFLKPFQRTNEWPPDLLPEEVLATAGPSSSWGKERASRRSGLRAIPRKNYEGTDQPEECEKDFTYMVKDQSRRNAEKRAAASREGDKCVYTHSSAIEVAHILPFAWTASELKKSYTHRYLHATTLLPFIDAEKFEGLGYLLEHVGGLDWAWNMITLKQSLHYFWGKAYIGMDVYAVTPRPSWESEKSDKKGKKVKKGEADEKKYVDVDLAFYWLGTNNVKPSAIVNFSHGAPRWIDGIARTDTTMVSLRDHECESGRLLRDGHLTTITLPEEDVDKFVIMVKLQWVLVRIARLCGGGEKPEDLPSFRDCDGFWSPTTIHDWEAMLGGPVEREQEQKALGKQTPAQSPVRPTTEQPTTPTAKSVTKPVTKSVTKSVTKPTAKPTMKPPYMPPMAPMDPMTLQDFTNMPSSQSPRASPSPERKGKGKAKDTTDPKTRTVAATALTLRPKAASEKTKEN